MYLHIVRYTKLHSVLPHSRATGVISGNSSEPIVLLYAIQHASVTILVMWRVCQCCTIA